MTDLTPLTALGTSTPWSQSFGALHIREVTSLALSSLACPNGTGDRPAPFGMTLPSAGRCVATTDFGAFWMGPNQWMIEGYDAAQSDFAAKVKQEAPRAYVSEQTDGWCAFDIIATDKDRGNDTNHNTTLVRLLQKLVNLDANAFGPGCATRTALHHMNVFLIRRSDNHLTILGMRSLAGALKHAICAAATRLDE